MIAGSLHTHTRAEAGVQLVRARHDKVYLSIISGPRGAHPVEECHRVLPRAAARARLDGGVVRDRVARHAELLHTKSRSQYVGRSQ